MTEPLDARVMFGVTTREEAQNTCVICLEPMTDSNSVKLEGCTHKFHSTCAIKWFRMGNTSCPLCKYQPSAQRIGWHRRKARVSINKRFARRKDAPAALKRLVTRLANAHTRRKNNAKLFREWKKTAEGLEYKRLRKIWLRHERKSCLWRFKQIRDLEAEISEYPIIPLVVMR